MGQFQEKLHCYSGALWFFLQTPSQIPNLTPSDSWEEETYRIPRDNTELLFIFLCFGDHEHRQAGAKTTHKKKKNHESSMTSLLLLYNRSLGPLGDLVLSFHTFLNTYLTKPRAGAFGLREQCHIFKCLGRNMHLQSCLTVFQCYNGHYLFASQSYSCMKFHYHSATENLRCPSSMSLFQCC